MSLREAIVDNARWGAASEPQIHYSQAAGRMAAVHSPRQLPLYTDCSGFVTLCYSWAGAPDPNGRGYNGTGYTGTLLNHLEHISKDELRPADLVVFGPYPGDHVVIVVEEGADPLTVSHGQEKGPILIRLSREVAAHRAPTFYLRGDGLDTAPAPIPAPVEDDMTPDQDKRLTDVEDMSKATNAAVGRLEVAIGDPTNGLYVKFNALEAQVAAIAKKLGA